MYPIFTEWIKNKCITESLERHCFIYKSNTGKWWLELADEEYGEHWDSTVYGPFSSAEEAEKELEQHSNPGSFHVDSSGQEPDPEKSPNGTPIKEPYSKKRSRFRF